MDRRGLLHGAGWAFGSPLLLPPHRPARAGDRAGTSGPVRRCRPGDATWPSAAEWEELNRLVGGRLVAVRSPLAACRDAPDGPAC